MLSLYEILKASKTGIAPDMWTALAGMNWGGADSGHEVKELTGIPPLSFAADGTPLLDYLISGNTIQNGTPTPSNPVEVNGIGVRTENLWDGAIGLDNTRLNRNDGITVADPNYALSDYIPVSASTSYVYSFRHNQYEPNRTSFTVSFYKSGKQLVQEILLQHINDEGAIAIPFTTPDNTAYIRINWKKPYDDMLMLSLGSTAKPFEPYGYKIPISSGGVTTNLYLGSTQSERKIDKLVLTGDENWIRTATDATHNRYQLTVSDMLPFGTRLTPMFCTHYQNICDGRSIGDVPNNSIYSGQNQDIYIKTTSITSLTDFKAYLAQQYANGTPVTVWYVLAEPTTATVNEPLMKIGTYADTVSMEQAGVQIPTLHGNTVIDVLTELKPSQMYIKYRE